MNILTKLQDKKPPLGKKTLYAEIIFCWVTTGWIVLLALVSIIASTDPSKYAYPTWLTVFFVIIAIILVTLNIRYDSRRGYIDALYNNYLRKREERIKAREKS